MPSRERYFVEEEVDVLVEEEVNRVLGAQRHIEAFGGGPVVVDVGALPIAVVVDAGLDAGVGEVEGHGDDAGEVGADDGRDLELLVAEARGSGCRGGG